MSAPHKIKIKTIPTHAQLSEFILSLLPPHPRDIPLQYHTPRYPTYNPSTTPVQDVVLSITPTPSVYTTMTHLATTVLSPDHRRLKPACFLHRPFNLDRRAVPGGCLVLASHKRFDELLTVGWNVILASRLGLDVQTGVCVQGYKQDAERRIGLVARLGQGRSLREVHSDIVREFGEGEVFHAGSKGGMKSEVQVRSIAIMNAFGPDEVDRAMGAAVEKGFIAEGEYGALLYLTGEPKELGLAAMKEKYPGMTAVCVGHRPAEEWGIKCLGGLVKREWEDISVHFVFEDEEVPEKMQLKPDGKGGEAQDRGLQGDEVSAVHGRVAELRDTIHIDKDR